MSVGFEAEIKPLFRPRDVNAMLNFGGFDLRVYDDVKEHAEGIAMRLADGSMPCDAAWPATQVALFRQWIDGGFAP